MARRRWQLDGSAVAALSTVAALSGGGSLAVQLGGDSLAATAWRQRSGGGGSGSAVAALSVTAAAAWRWRGGSLAVAAWRRHAKIIR